MTNPPDRGNDPSRKPFVSAAELADMYSGDYDVKMSQVAREMDRYSPGPAHLGPYARHGGRQGYVNHLAEDIKNNGIRDPIQVRGTNVVVQGHHRALAAMQLGLDKIPVEHFD